MILFADFSAVFYFTEEALLSIIEILLILKLYHRVFGKPSLPTRKLYIQAILVLLAAAVSLSIIIPERSVAMPPLTMLCSLLFLRHYPSGRRKKLLFGTVLFVIAWLWLMIADILITPLQRRHYFIILIFARLVFWLLLELIPKMGKYDQTDIPISLWLLFLAIALSSLTVLHLISYYMTRRDNPYQVTTEIPVMLALLLINLSLFVFFDRFSVLMHDSRQKLLLEQQLYLQEQHYRELAMAHQQIRALQHDMNNYLQTVAHLGAKQESSSELIAFVNNAGRQFTRIEQLVSTGNACMDSILNIKLSEMKQEHIPVDTKILVPPNLNLSFEQSVILFGNLLDNAKEACLALPPQERFTKLQITYTNHTLLIRIENSSHPVTRWKGGLPLTTKISAKQDSSLHGLGLKNVQRAVEQSGTFHIEAAPASFLVKIALYDLFPQSTNAAPTKKD